LQPYLPVTRKYGDLLRSPSAQVRIDSYLCAHAQAGVGPHPVHVDQEINERRWFGNRRRSPRHNGAVELWTHTATRSEVIARSVPPTNLAALPKLGEVSQNSDYRRRDTGMRFKARAGATAARESRVRWPGANPRPRPPTLKGGGRRSHAARRSPRREETAGHPAQQRIPLKATAPSVSRFPQQATAKLAMLSVTGTKAEQHGACLNWGPNPFPRGSGHLLRTDARGLYDSGTFEPHAGIGAGSGGFGLMRSRRAMWSLRAIVGGG